MAQPVTLPFSNFKVEIGDGANPEVFGFPCGLTSRSLDIKATTGDTDVPDCDNEDLPSWTQRDIKTLAATVSGQGVLSQAAHPVWRTWALQAIKKNVRIGPIQQTLAQGGGYYAGVGILSDFKVTANKGERVTVDITIDIDGALVWVPATA